MLTYHHLLQLALGLVPGCVRSGLRPQLKNGWCQVHHSSRINIREGVGTAIDAVFIAFSEWAFCDDCNKAGH